MPAWETRQCRHRTSLPRQRSTVCLGRKLSHNAHEVRSHLAAHRDHGTATAINIILKGSGPITWDEDIDLYYECALLNVQQMHSVFSNDDRIFLKLAIFDKSYDEVLKAIEGKESEMFGIDLL